MIKHLVMFKIKPELPKDKTALEIKKRLEAMTPQIDEIDFLEVGINLIPSPTSQLPTSFDVVLTTHHQNLESYQNYQQNPIHVEIKSYLTSITSHRALVDYEC